MRAAAIDANGATFLINAEALLRLTRVKVKCASAHRAMPAPRKIDISVAAASAVVVECAVSGVTSGVGVSDAAGFGVLGGVFGAAGIGAGWTGVITPDRRDGAKILASGERKYST